MVLRPDQDLDRQAEIDGSRSLHGGQNSRDWPGLLNEFQAVAIQNADVDELGKITRRKGAISLDSPTAVSEPLGIGLWHPPSSRTQRRMVGLWGGSTDNIQMYQSQGDGAWETFDTGVSLVAVQHQFQRGRAFYTPQTGGSSGQTQSVATLFIASAFPSDSGGSFPLSGLIYRHDIVTETDRASQTLDVRPRAITWWQGRLWAANSASTGHGLSWLGWSDIFNGASGWEDALQNIEVDPDDNDEITALAPLRGSENLIYIWKSRSIWRLSVVWDTDGFYTESVDILDTTQSRLAKIASNIGCVATKSVIEVTLPDGSGDIFFLAHDGIRSIRRAEQDTAGGAGRPITDQNAPLIERINQDAVHKAVATVHDNLALFAVPLDGATSNNNIIVIDLSKNELPLWTYTLDATDLIDIPLATAERRAYMQNAQVQPNDSSVTGHHVWQLFTGMEDPGGTTIEFKVETRAFSHQDPRRLKRWDFVEVQAFAEGSDVTLCIGVKIDESDEGFTDVGKIPITPTANQFPIIPFQLPFVPAGGAAQIKALGLLSFDPGHIIEVQVKENASFASFGLRNVAVAARPFPRQSNLI